jgi:hypothetical protein
MRIWSDNTGKYTCVGRLIEIEPHRIRLLKENGNTSTVPIERLSLRDLRFVHAQTLASLRRSEIHELAQAPN